MGFLPVLRPPACSGSASSGGFSSPLWFTPFVMGHPCGVEASLSSIGTKVWCVFPFPLGCFLVLSLPFGMKSPYGSGVGLARPPVVVDAVPFLLMVGLRTSV